MALVLRPRHGPSRRGTRSCRPSRQLVGDAVGLRSKQLSSAEADGRRRSQDLLTLRGPPWDRDGERTTHDTAWPFAWVRNPIFTGMLLVAAGSAANVPTPLTVLGLLVAVGGMSAQVRLVEEPHLRQQHGAAYDAYAGTTGRFLPRVLNGAA